MFNVVVNLPTAQLEFDNERLGHLTQDLNALVAQDVLPVANQMVEVLSTPPPPAAGYYPLRWASERQRRYVMAMLRAQGNLPYQRTGQLEQGWYSALAFTANGGAITIGNDTPYANYVQGDDIQPMFQQIPWMPLALVAQAGFEEIQEIVVQDWYFVTGASS